MTFHLFGGGPDLCGVVGPQLSSAVIGPGRNGDFTISYTKDEADFRHIFQNPSLSPWAGFLERQRPHIQADALLEDPFAFLHRPATGGWAETHGAGIFSKI